MRDRRGLRVAVTGAAGRVGKGIRPELEKVSGYLCLLDLSVEPDASGNWLAVDIRNPVAISQALIGIDVVVHLAGIPDEAPFADILESNIVGTYNVFEAAREAAVRRVVFASSHHVVGFYPTNQTVDPDMPPRPDTYYGVSKVTGEALGRLYHDKWGLEVINIRIGAFRDQPTLPRHQSVWLSVNDASRLVASAVTAPGIGYLTVFGVSANTASWWDSQGGYRLLGFTPRDDASLVTSGTSEAETHHGGVYTDPEYWGGSG